MVEVAVIGAGAAGLVASRHLLRCGLRPCIFESNTRTQGVGGAWNAAGRSYKMWGNLTPNLSRYTCVFSDFLWPEDAATFPSRADVECYLGNYQSTFVDPEYFRYGCTVTNIKRCNNNNIHQDGGSGSGINNMLSDGFKQQFQVEWADQGTGESQTQVFDGVIVATGFFAIPFLPEGLTLPSRDDDDDDTNKNLIIHSSQYRSTSDFCNETVAVCGASFSALEIAADVRKQASKVISILPRIPYVLPRYVQTIPPPPSSAPPQSDNTEKNSGGGFAPLDTVLYQRSRDAPQTPPSIEMTAAQSKAKHEFLRQLSGTRKQRLSPLGFPSDVASPPLVAISDDYLNLVIDGNIETVKGRVVKTKTTSKNNVLLDDDNNKGNNYSIDLELDIGKTLSGIDRVIACTGYQSQLQFLEPDILKTLEYDQADRHAPLTLCHDTFHPKIPGLGFVGMYKGPYFGVMELQARLLAGLFSGDVNLSEESITEALQESKNIRRFSSLLGAQFPRYDYIGFMDSLAKHLNLIPSGEYGVKGAVVAPPFFQQESKEIAGECKKALDQELNRSSNDEHEEEGSGGGSVNMARVALSAMVGKWDFRRTITQFNSPSELPQCVTGEITFSHIPPPPLPNKEEEESLLSHSTGTKQEWNSVLYDEKGIFYMAGKELDVFRQYEYEYKENGILEVYFVEFGKRAHLFLSLKFSKKENGYWIATSDHLCIKDLYKANFKIAFDGLGASEVIMTYRVRGPNKDYESVTHLLPH